MLGLISELFDGLDGTLGPSCVLDLGMPPAAAADFVRMHGPIISEWKLAATSWFMCDATALKAKIRALKAAGATLVAGGTAGEIAVHLGHFERYLDVCARLGFDRVEVGEGFVACISSPGTVVAQARSAGLALQFEVGRKRLDEDRLITSRERLGTARKWLDAGASHIVIEAREVGEGYALFGSGTSLNRELADSLVSEIGLDRLVFEAPNRDAQVAVLSALGPSVSLANIYPAELARVEMFRRGVHADTIHLCENWRRNGIDSS